eukprot:s9233_g2.t1
MADFTRCVTASSTQHVSHVVPVPVQYRNHYKTITHIHHVTVPEKVVVPAPPPREINHIVHVPVVHVPVPMPAKTIYKEIPITKVQHVIQKRYYDCVAGIKNWHYGWSKTKKSWCCSHEQRGWVTQHIGHGHVHVIHHVHHYSTSSHDVDDLPDVIGDDDASLPPEYRHGDMSVGGDDDSLPPEYRHVDMTVGGDDDDSLRPEHRHVDLNVDE